ncbi:MAG: MFS transporter [Chloroflexi bacterium]|nr:MFS transporter [Chloroflexota bacterium]
MAIAARLARHRLYYGWYIAGLVFASNMAAAGLGSGTSGMFIKPMTEDLGWSRLFFATAVSLGTVAVSPISLFMGPLIDNRGARLPMLAGGFALGAGLIAMGFVQSQWHFILVRALLIPLGMTALSQLAPSVAVANWFVKKRGRVMAITTMGLTTGFFTMTPVSAFLIEELGWRQAWIVLGLVAWAVVLAPIALLMRRRPEDVGLLPDGEGGSGVATGRRPARDEATWTRKEAMGTRTFWLLALALPIGVMGVDGILVHLFAYLTDMAFNTQTATLVVMALYAGALTVKIPIGFIAERVPVRYCTAAIFVLIGIGIALLPVAGGNKPALFETAFLIGLGWGGQPPMVGLSWANYYGRLSQGRVQSVAQPVSAVLRPLGAVLAGYTYDRTGSYEGIFMVFVAIEVVAVVLALLALPPKKRDQAVAIQKEAPST